MSKLNTNKIKKCREIIRKYNEDEYYIKFRKKQEKRLNRKLTVSELENNENIQFQHFYSSVDGLGETLNELYDKRRIDS